MKDDIKLLLRYVKSFLSKKKFIFLVVGLFFILGIFVAIFTPKAYLSQTSFVTQISGDSKMGSGLKNIADLIGLNLGSKSESKDLPIFLYPKIMNSLSYQREMMDTKINIRGIDSAVTLKYYYTDIKKPDFIDTAKKYTVGLPGLILKNFKSKPESNGFRLDSLEYVSPAEGLLIKRLSDDVTFGVDEFDGTITIGARMPENIAAAQIAENAKIILQKKVIAYRLGKAQERFDFVNEQYLLKKQDFLSSQATLARYTDRNRFNNTQTSLVKRQQLESEYNLAYMVYSELESQRIREEINLNEDTPVFTTLQPAIVPVLPVNENAAIVVLKYIFIGFIAAIFLYVFKEAYKMFKNLYKTS